MKPKTYSPYTGIGKLKPIHKTQGLLQSSIETNDSFKVGTMVQETLIPKALADSMGISNRKGKRYGKKTK